MKIAIRISAMPLLQPNSMRKGWTTQRLGGSKCRKRLSWNVNDDGTTRLKRKKRKRG
jgi:hypothetical protein